MQLNFWINSAAGGIANRMMQEQQHDSEQDAA